MNIFESSYRPLSFKSKFGSPLKIYSTTFSKDLFAVFIISILAFIIGGVSMFQSVSRTSEEMLISTLCFFLGLLIPAYIYLGNRFRYIALFEKGLVVKKRFRTYKIYYRDISMVKLVNALPYKNLFKSSENRDYAIDIYLKDSSIVSYGMSQRLFNSITHPRVYSGVRVLEIHDLVEKIKNQTPKYYTQQRV